MIISQYFVWFIIFSFIGWIYECIYCTIKSHHWENRGFLYGPVCPIYGTGAVLAVAVFGSIRVADVQMPMWQVFLICMAGSAVIEYVTSYVLEKMFHAVWWDYSKVPLNLHGRICLPASIGFGVAGVLIVRFILPLTEQMSGFLPPLAKEGLSLVFMAVFAGDLVLTVSGLTQLVNRIEAFETELNERMEAAYQIVEGKRQIVEERMQEYERLTTDKMREYADHMSYYQKHALSSMKNFRSEKTDGVADRLKETLTALKNVRNNKKTGKENQM